MKTKGQRVVLQCNFCGKQFARTINERTYEVPCPKCRETDVEIVGQVKS